MGNSFTAQYAEKSGTFAFDRLREAITATLETLAAGKITPKELPILRNDTTTRYAPGFGKQPPLAAPNHPYTVEGLAKFLGETKEGTGSATESFKATFGALELIDGNGLKEGDIAGLEVWKIDAVVSLRNGTHGAGRHRHAIVSTRMDTRTPGYWDGGVFLLHSMQGAESGTNFLLDNGPEVERMSTNG